MILDTQDGPGPVLMALQKAAIKSLEGGDDSCPHFTDKNLEGGRDFE